MKGAGVGEKGAKQCSSGSKARELGSKGCSSRVRRNRTSGSLNPYGFEVRNSNHRISVPHVTCACVVVGIFISKVAQHSPPSAIVESLQCAKKIASISALKSPGQERGVERRTQTPERHKKSRAMHLLDAPLDKCRGVVFSLTFLLAGILRANARA